MSATPVNEWRNGVRVIVGKDHDEIIGRLLWADAIGICLIPEWTESPHLYPWHTVRCVIRDA